MIDSIFILLTSLSTVAVGPDFYVVFNSPSSGIQRSQAQLITQAGVYAIAVTSDALLTPTDPVQVDALQYEDLYPREQHPFRYADFRASKTKIFPDIVMVNEQGDIQHLSRLEHVFPPDRCDLIRAKPYGQLFAYQGELITKNQQMGHLNPRTGDWDIIDEVVNTSMCRAEEIFSPAFVDLIATLR